MQSRMRFFFKFAFLAEVIGFPGVLAYGHTKGKVVARVQALTLRVLVDKLEHG